MHKYYPPAPYKFLATNRHLNLLKIHPIGPMSVLGFPTDHEQGFAYQSLNEPQAASLESLPQQGYTKATQMETLCSQLPQPIYFSGTKSP